MSLNPTRPRLVALPNRSASEPSDAPATDRAATASAHPAKFTFSTDGLTPDARFETWRDIIVRRYLELDIRSPSPSNFRGSVDLWSAGGVAVAGFEISRSSYLRSQSTARNNSDDFNLVLSRQGMFVSSTGEDTHGIDSGSAVLMPGAKGGTIDVTGDCRIWNLKIDGRKLAPLLPRNVDLRMHSIAAGHPVLELIKGYLPLITGGADAPGPAAIDMMGAHIVDLVALLFSPSRDALPLIAGRGLKAARIQAVLDAIDRYFAEPGLTAERIGRALGISGRQVNRLLEETPMTFYEHLTERRLQWAYRTLADPAHNGLKVADIAMKAGFSDPAHFHRAFRIRFGDTPLGARTAATESDTLRVLRRSLGR